MAPSSTLHPQAKFDPIPPDLDLHSLVDRTPNFDWVVRISTAQLTRLGSAGFEKLVQLHVINGGKPLVIEGWNRLLPKSLFGTQWLEKSYDKKQENVRDINLQTDIPMTMGHYLRSMRQLANQWTPTNFRSEKRQRLYLKDIDCPTEWFDHLKKVIPPNVFYMNENVSENPGGELRSDHVFGAGEASAAVAGDLMSSLPEEMRALNMMCYIGHEGTYTPAHREMCASLGHNIMVEASGDENGEKAGSSIWFMTETKDRDVIREYFLSMLGHDIEIEKHFAQINAWKKANFPVYVVEQKVGDFILVPPLAPHQVWNRGTRTMKVAWNRTTVETLDLALHEALPRARLVCRDEQYKNKAIIYYTLEKYYKQLQSVDDSTEVGWLGLGQELTRGSPRMKQMAGDFKRLFGLFTEVLVNEMFGYKHMDLEYLPFDSNITCSYCRSNIFNRFLTCKCCVRELVGGDQDTYDVCMECYAMGRSCVCVSGLQWCEQWLWSDLVEKHETWRAMIIKQDGYIDLDNSPPPLELARIMSGKKSVAQICQEQLRRRPWNDITQIDGKDEVADESDEAMVDQQGGSQKKKKGSKKKKSGETYRCHTCCRKENIWKLQFCSTCQEAYCYGVLWRGFDMLPQDAMEQEHWQCPRCQGICNCGHCRQRGIGEPYVPKSTLLGHDTRRIADDRSIESIVDFRTSNLNWLKAAGEDERSKDTKRMKRLREQADAEKAKDPLAALEASADGEARELNALVKAVDMNGQTPGPGSNGLSAEYNGESSHAPNGENGEGEAGATAARKKGESDSAYPDLPDPRMMGMGFYDQDESADRILFDAFELPTADAINGEPEVSEFVKKTLRLAKRKARLEMEDDPDFRGPKYQRKKPKTGNLDQMINLDPSLLGTLGAGHESGQDTPTAAQHATAGDSAASGKDGAAASQESPSRQRAASAADSLKVTLRHARPSRSYAELPDPEDDPEDFIRKNWAPTLVSARRASESAKQKEAGQSAADPVDLAADAIRALTQFDSGDGLVVRRRRGRSSAAASPNVASSNTAQVEGRRRSGRGSGRPTSSSLGSSSVAQEHFAKTRVSGRLRRSTLGGNVKDGEDTSMVDIDDVAKEGDVDSAAESEQEADEKAGQKRGPATRSRRPSGPGKKATHTAERRPMANLPKRGGPSLSGTKSAAAGDSATEPLTDGSNAKAIVTGKPVAAMSMAERMAAVGKKIKIRGKTQDSTGPASTASTPVAGGTASTNSKRNGKERKDVEPAKITEKAGPAVSRGDKGVNDGSFLKAQASVGSSGAGAEAESAVAGGVSKGPTIVRLDEVQDESDSGPGSPHRPGSASSLGGVGGMSENGKSGQQPVAGRTRGMSARGAD